MLQHLRDIFIQRPFVVAAAIAGISCILLAASAAEMPPMLALGLLGLATALAIWVSMGSNGIATQRSAPDLSAADATDISWRTVIDALPEPALVLNDAGRVLHASRAGRELFPSVAEGQQIGQVIRSPELLAAIEQALATGTARIVHSLERVPIERRIRVTVSPLPGARMSPSSPALLLAFRDVSQEERLAQMRSDFIANASHELRTPLTSLRGFIETLQGQARDDEAARKQFLEIMATQAGRMSRLLDDLLSLSRLEMRAHVPPRGEVELNEIVREVTDLLQPIAMDGEITLHFVQAPAACRVRGDRDELVQVFQNLVQNAIKYGRRGGRVDVNVTREAAHGGIPGRVVVAVRDDGPGIAEEHLPRLTERFYRVDVAASRDKGGTGLGLAIVKHVLNRHHGQLRIQSQVGKGSTFIVSLDLLPG